MTTTNAGKRTAEEAGLAEVPETTTTTTKKRENGASDEVRVGLKPLNPAFSVPLLTDMYELTMAYGYWFHGKHEQHGVFDLYFRTCPFRGEFTIFAGLEECVSASVLSNYKFTEPQLDYLKRIMPHCDPRFWEWLKGVDCSKIKIYAHPEGYMCFPKVPLLRVEGPVAVAQLLESPLLNLINYASLVATNAARYRVAAGANVTLLEFGLRRAQGPDGAISASRYSMMGGFDGTSNVLAGQLFDVVPKGTLAHSFITSFHSGDRALLAGQKIRLGPGVSSNGNGLSTPTSPFVTRAMNPTTRQAAETDSSKLVEKPFLELVEECKAELGFQYCHEGELLAYCAYALAYPDNFLVLVDTYDTLSSGLSNFLTVALALHRCGWKPVGVRLDSGDLAYLSKRCREAFRDLAQRYGIEYFRDLAVVASNDLSEKTILSLNQQGHEINCFGVGTDLVTCKSQPALGGVYKLVELEGKPRIKLSEEVAKVTLPGKKDAFRLYDKNGTPIFDVLTLSGGVETPKAGQRLLCRHPFEETKRAYVTPSKVQPLLRLVWDGKIMVPLPSLQEIKNTVNEQLVTARPDHLRPLNPTPYKVSVTGELYSFLHEMWLQEAPIREID